MERRKFLIGLGALASGSAAALGTGAFSAAEAERTVDVEITDDSASLLGLEPGPDTGGIVTTESRQYGMHSADADALTIDFTNGHNGMDTGMNAGSTYQVGTPPESVDKPSYWNDRLLVNQEDGVTEEDHAFSIHNHNTQEQDITVRFEGESSSRTSGHSNVGLVLVDSDGNAVADTDNSSEYRAEVSMESVGAGESVYVVLSFNAADEIASNDIGGDMTIIAN